MDFEPKFANTPTKAAARYLETNKPDTDSLQLGAKIIAKSRSKSTGSDIFTICNEVSNNPLLKTRGASILAALLIENSPCIPGNWKTNQEIMRTALSMSALIDIANLAVLDNQKKDTGLKGKIEALKKLNIDLHAPAQPSSGGEFRP